MLAASISHTTKHMYGNGRPPGLCSRLASCCRATGEANGKTC